MAEKRIGLNNNDINQNIPVVGGIIERFNGEEKEILIQTRWKPGVSEYSGLYEFAIGWTEKYENIYEGLKREVKEETGLDILKVKGENEIILDGFHNDSVMTFSPFCCTQQLKGGLPWVSFIFICEVANNGIIKDQREETKNVHWIKYNDLYNLVKNTPEKFFSLELGALKKYFSI